jgi:hypothetical protein
MYFATKTSRTRILVWLFWFIVLLVCIQPAATSCRNSKVGHLLTVTVCETVAEGVNLYWELDKAALHKVERKDGRYLLVTNDWSLSHERMFALYRQKDGVEKRFTVCKSDLKVSPVYLHQDKRIASMLLLNMVALLAYSLLERQVRRQGLQLTTRQIIKRLETLTLIETHCHDGSSLRRLTPLEPIGQSVRLKALFLRQCQR